MYDLSFFRKEGFQILPKAIPIPALEAVKEFLSQEALATIDELTAFFGLMDKTKLASHIVDLSTSPDFKNVERSLQLKLSGHFSLHARLSPHLLSIAKLPVMQELFKAIFPNHKPRLHMPPTARFVLPHNALAGVPPHQDISYNTHIDDFFVVWVPFSEITDKKGGVQVFKGTNQQKQIALPESSNFWLEELR